ncbi:hypothetical protein, partial [Streptomyces sp. NPDC051921]|uniref:hypothetical protein n=1 Tax=Streptomyces sp. NPDC051921 TaxID=3155806 RepID=UPI00343DF9AA
MLKLRTWGTAVLVLSAVTLAPVPGRTPAAPSDAKLSDTSHTSLSDGELSDASLSAGLSDANLSTAVYLSNGTRFPGWSQWSDRDGGWIEGTPWVAGDFNGDKKADLATVWNNGGSNTITVSLSTG